MKFNKKMEIEYNKKNKNLDKKNTINNNPSETIINLLTEIPYIKILPTYTIQDICHLAYIKIFKKNEIIIKQGEPISNLYIVKAGTFISLINERMITNISHDINSFLQYQNITNEPFLEERKYELQGKIINNEQISLFIYSRANFFGDIELITGSSKSYFTIKANEDDSVLCYINRNEWVKYTKRIRIPFTKVAIDKMNRIHKRIVEVKTRKNKMDINKVKLNNDKINNQIEIIDDYELCVKKIEEKEEKIENQIEKYKAKDELYQFHKNKNIKRLKQLQHNKNYVLNLFKFPKIIKDETKTILNKFLHSINNKRSSRKMKLYQTKSYFNLNQIINTNKYYSPNNNLSLFYHSNNESLKKSDFMKYKSKLFLTNSIKNINKNNSMNDIYSVDSNKIRFNHSNNYGKLVKANVYSLKRNYQNIDIEEYSKFHNLAIKKVINKNNNENNQDNKNYKKIKIVPEIISRNNYNQSYSNQPSRNSEFFANKKEKVDLEKINYILQERYNLSKNKIIEKILGKKEKNNSVFN